MGKDHSQDRHKQKRVADNVCAACRKNIEDGHRINMAFIVLDRDAYNPQKITEKGLALGTDYEFTHVRCEDPFLNGKSD